MLDVMLYDPNNMSYLPSLVACSAYYLASGLVGNSQNIGQGIWGDVMVDYSSYTEEEVQDCAKSLGYTMEIIEKFNYPGFYRKYPSEFQKNLNLLL